MSTPQAALNALSAAYAQKQDEIAQLDRALDTLRSQLIRSKSERDKLAADAASIREAWLQLGGSS